MKLENNELMSISGGAFTAALLNAFVSLMNKVIEVGRMVGSSFRRISTGAYCPAK